MRNDGKDVSSEDTCGQPKSMRPAGHGHELFLMVFGVVQQKAKPKPPDTTNLLDTLNMFAAGHKLVQCVSEKRSLLRPTLPEARAPKANGGVRAVPQGRSIDPVEFCVGFV